MGDKTGIEWCDATWNPIRGCTRVSEGCRHCYAEVVAGRFSGPGQPYEGLARRTASGEARWTGQIAFIEHVLEQPLRWQRPRMIFVNSMSDLFHEGVTEGMLVRIFAVMEACRSKHRFLILTKRPERAQDWFDFWNRDGNVAPNIWLGVSAEDQGTWNARVPVLLDTNVAVRTVSAEPLLGPIEGASEMHAIDWLKVGAESGKGARPMREEWVRRLRDVAVDNGTKFFYKQNVVGGRKISTPELDGRTWTEMPDVR